MGSYYCTELQIRTWSSEASRAQQRCFNDNMTDKVTLLKMFTIIKFLFEHI